MSARVEITCEQCGKKFTDFRSNYRRYCSKSCAGRNGPKTHGDSGTRLYQIWTDMKNRCYCKSSPAYAYYGARGIIVAAEWLNDYSAFKTWALASGYSKLLELDRKKVNGIYCPENCRWATRTQQMRNTRKRRDGKTSRYKGVSWCKINKKWKVQCCIGRTNGYGGLYPSALMAAMAYDDLAFRLGGEFALLNFPERIRYLEKTGGVPS